METAFSPLEDVLLGFLLLRGRTPAVVAAAAGLPIACIEQRGQHLGLLCPPVPTDVTLATYSAVFAWAGERGLASARDGMDLGAVNRKRVQLGLPPFEIAARHRVQAHGLRQVN